MELFSISKFRRSDWNSTLILQFRFHLTVAMKLQQFALTLIQRRYGLGAVTTNWIREIMKKLLLITASLVAISAAAPASAADLAARPYTKAPPMMAAIYDWSGFYIGINGGGATSRNSWDLVGGGTEGHHDSTGGTVGGQIGYRWQTGPVVFGVEAQGNWADFSGSNTSLLFNESNRTKIDAFGLFTGQIGYAWNNVLLYAKGGAAVTDNKYEINALGGGGLLASTSNTRWGGVVGAGLEYGFAPNWSVAFEYDHMFMDRQNVNFVATTFTQTDSIKQDVDLFTARLNYKFGGPVIGKY
jgi:outer membrane immunogenic protein